MGSAASEPNGCHCDRSQQPNNDATHPPSALTHLQRFEPRVAPGTASGCATANASPTRRQYARLRASPSTNQRACGA
jgi:hypothetical protein